MQPAFTLRIAQLSVVSVAILTAIAAPLLAEGGLSKAEASALVRDAILPELDLPTDYVALLFDRPLTARDSLAPYAPDPIPADVMEIPHLVPYALDRSTWFLWIDLRPLARYAHPTLFVLIDASDGSYVAHEEQWWPVLNGDSLWTEPSAYWDPGDWVAAAGLPLLGRPAPVSESGCETDVPRLNNLDWILLVNGWSPGQPGELDFGADIRTMCEATTGMRMKTDVLLPEEASPEAVEAFIVRLFTEIAWYTCCERLYVYFTCHASPGALWIGGRRLSATELARILSTPGNTYVPSRVYFYIDANYGGTFLPDLPGYSGIMRGWTASAADGFAYQDIDPSYDPDPEDVGGEWTSSVVSTLNDLLYSQEGADPVADVAVRLRRYYVALNMAFGASAAKNAAVLGGLSDPSDYLFSDNDPEEFAFCVTYMSEWDRAVRLSRDSLPQTIDRYGDVPCEAFLRVLNDAAKHNAGAPAGFDLHEGKQCARDLSHSDFWEYCDIYWQIMAAE